MTNLRSSMRMCAFFVVLGFFSGIASAETKAPAMPSTAGVPVGAPPGANNAVNQAQGQANGMANHPCKADAEKLCPGMAWGKGIGQCLEKNMGSLSAGCKDKMTADHPCLADRMSLCGSAKTPKDVHECMQKNADKVSPACKARMARAPMMKPHPTK